MRGALSWAVEVCIGEKGTGRQALWRDMFEGGIARVLNDRREYLGRLEMRSRCLLYSLVCMVNFTRFTMC